MTTIKEQAEFFLNLIETRRQRRAKPRTIRTYQSYIRTWINPLVGAEELAGFKNAGMKQFVAELNAAGLSAASVVGVVNLLKSIIASAMDEEGEELYPRKWNNEFLDVPVVNPREQHAPIVTSEQLSQAIKDAPGQLGLFFALLAGTGLRISEALALKAGSDDGRSSLWLPAQQKIVVRGQVQDGQFISPKTEAGFREVEVHQTLADRLNWTGGYLFGGDKPLPVRTAYLFKDRLGLPGFHAFRRFRITRLRETQVPEDLIRYWSGHSDRSITDRYSRLGENTEVRKSWCEKAGLGFQLNAA